MLPNRVVSKLYRIQSYAFRAVAATVMIGWGLGLATYTLHLQHSCAPLVPRSLPDSCKPQVEASQPGSASRFRQWKDTFSLERFSKAPSIDWPSLQPVKLLPERLKQTIQIPREASPAVTEQPPDLSSQPVLSNRPLFDPSQIGSNEAVAIVVGSAALIGLAVIEVPITVAAGAGVAIWYAARTIASAAF